MPTSSAAAGIALQIPTTADTATAYLIIACSYKCKTLEPIPCYDECSGQRQSSEVALQQEHPLRNVSLYKVDHLSLPPRPQIAAAEKTPDQSLAGNSANASSY